MQEVPDEKKKDLEKSYEEEMRKLYEWLDES